MQTQATVIERESLGPAWWELTFDTAQQMATPYQTNAPHQMAVPNLPPSLRPGQFLMLHCGDDAACYLRRPIFPRPLEKNRLSLLLRPQTDAGLAWLSARQVGDVLDVIGPLGNGFTLPEGIGNLLLISNTQQLGPLLGLMDQAVEAGLSITLALEGSRAAALYPAAKLPPPVELQTATLDGSIGHRGSITTLLPDLLRWADMVCAVGSPALYRGLKEQTQSVRFGVQPGFLYGLVDTYPMACGTGACFSCTLQTDQGLKLICTDGPVLDLATVNFGDFYNG